MRNPNRIYIYTPRKRLPSLRHLRSHFFAIRQKMMGKSNGPSEVLKSVSRCAELKRFRKLSQIPSEATIWIPDQEESFLEFSRVEKFSQRRVIFGPNIRVQESIVARTIREIPNYLILVPSNSMKNILLKMQPDYLPDRIRVWPAGIDIENWKPSDKKTHNRVVVYSKGPDNKAATEYAIAKIKARGFQIDHFQYGHYRQREFKNSLDGAKFTVWIGHTETQGIAQFQTWAMNVPTFILCLDSKTLLEPRGDLVSPAPYLSEQTGMISSTRFFQESDLEKFIGRLDQYSPRVWVQQNATDEISAKILMKMINNE